LGFELNSNNNSNVNENNNINGNDACNPNSNLSMCNNYTNFKEHKRNWSLDSQSSANIHGNHYKRKGKLARNIADK